jgi:hypothetical protein
MYACMYEYVCVYLVICYQIYKVLFGRNAQAEETILLTNVSQ